MLNHEEKEALAGSYPGEGLNARSTACDSHTPDTMDDAPASSLSASEICSTASTAGYGIPHLDAVACDHSCIVDGVVGRRPARPHPLLSRLISRFKSVRAKAPFAAITIEEMLAEIGAGIHADKCRRVANEPDERKRRALKAETLKAVAWVGVVTARKAGAPGECILAAKSGVAMIDFDDVTDPAKLKAKLAQHKHVVAAWLSSSSRGVQALVHLPDWCADQESHEAFMQWLISSSPEIFGHAADEHCTDLVRLSFESNDPDLIIKRDSVPFDVAKATCAKLPKSHHSVEMPTKREKREKPMAPDAAREMVVSAIGYLAKQGRPDYDLWLRIIAVSQLVMPEAEAESFLNEVLPEEEPGEYEEKLKHPLTHITVTGFLARAKDAGWRCPPLLGLGAEGKAYVAKVVYTGHDYMAPTRDGYIAMRTTQVRRHLRDAGVPESRIDDTLTLIEKTQNVDVVLDCFGRKAGIHEINGYRVLVTRDTVLMEAVPGDCATLMAFLTELLGKEQFGYFVGWLQKARRDFASGSSSPGQFLFLIGEVKTGKSLLMALLATMLGGRYGSGLSFLTGKSDFNKEIATVGIVGLDDELDGVDTTTRSKIRTRMKALGFSRRVAVTPKGVDSKTMEPVCRIVIVGNATEEVMQAVPLKTEDMADKVMLMKAHRVHGGVLDRLMADGNPLEALKTELPAFLDFVGRFELPADKTDPRTGVCSYWHPELLKLMDASDEDGPVIELLEANRPHLVGLPDGLGAAALLTRLLKVDEHVRTVLGTPNGVTFGKALARIAAKRPDLIRKGKVVHNTARWEVLG